MADSLVYSNARVKSLEGELFSNDKFTRLCYAQTINDAVKILLENNYGGIIIDNPYEYERLLAAEDKRVNAFLREVMPSKSGLEILLSKLDYHNVKAILKAKAQGISVDEGSIMSGGEWEYDRLYSSVNDNANHLPKVMADAIDDVKAHIAAGDITPRYIDVTLDKAYYASCVEVIKKCKSKAIKEYVTASIDLANAALFVRAKQINDKSILMQSYVEGGTVAIDTYDKLFEQNYDAVYEKLRYTAISGVIAEGLDELKEGKAPIAFERAADNYLFSIFRKDRNDIFSVAPLASFYLAKKQEIKMVRLICVCVKNNVGIERIKERMRELYA